MATSLIRISAAVVLLFTQSAISAEYPNMEGRWVGNIRVVSSGASGQVSSGGAVISESVLVFIVDYQDGETFIGRTQNSNASGSTIGVNVWGTIRSNGEEAMFVTNVGGNGLIWFEDVSTFEYCYTNMTEETATAYCAVLKKQE